MISVTTADAESARPTVFVFPGLSGEEEELAALCDCCATALRFVHINLPDWNDIHRHAVDLDGVVASCMAQIDFHAPPAPPLLAGYSFGGHIAYAVAAAFEASGRAVGLVALLDAHAIPPIGQNRLSIAQHLWRLAAAIRDGEVFDRIGQVAARVLMRSRYHPPLRLVARLRHARLPLNVIRHIDVALRMEFHLVILRQLLQRMALPGTPLKSPAILFRCAEQQADAADDLGWGRHLSRLKIVTTPGTHFSFMSPPNILPLGMAFIAGMGEALNASPTLVRRTRSDAVQHRPDHQRRRS